jgi:hypothetical protein
MTMDNDVFGSRMDAYKARSDAIAQMNGEALVVNAFINVMTFVFVVIGAIVVWFNPTIHWLLGLTFAVFFVRYVVKSIVSHAWALPRMQQLDKEFPMPTPRTKDTYKS